MRRLIKEWIRLHISECTHIDIGTLQLQISHLTDFRRRLIVIISAEPFCVFTVLQEIGIHLSNTQTILLEVLAFHNGWDNILAHLVAHLVRHLAELKLHHHNKHVLNKSVALSIKRKT